MFRRPDRASWAESACVNSGTVCYAHAPARRRLAGWLRQPQCDLLVGAEDATPFPGGRLARPLDLGANRCAHVRL
jgi:hypothetical protein